MTVHKRPEPRFPWWYAPASAAITGGAVAIPALSFPLNIAAAIVVAAGAGLYLAYHQGRADLPQGIGQGKRRVIALAFIALVLMVMALAVIVRLAELPGAMALVLAGCVIGFVYPGIWQAAG